MTSAPERVPAAADESVISVTLGRQIRNARTEKKLSMRALASAAEISQPFLSQIESGQAMPSIVTLFRIAKVLDLSASALLPAAPASDPIRVTRSSEGNVVRVDDAGDAATSRIISAQQASGATVQEYRLRGPYVGSWFESDGENTVYVVSGRVTVTIDGYGSWTLDAGDALASPGAMRNRWELDEATQAVVLLVHARGE